MAENVILPSWSIQTVGCRPVDYMVLDLLFGSLIRDPRAWEFQALSRKPPEILLAKTNHLSSAQRIHAVRVLILNSLQQRLYDRILSRFSDKRIHKVIKRMQQCPPMGALMPPNAVLRSCKNRLCPWCH